MFRANKNFLTHTLITMAEMAVILRGLATSNKGDVYGL